MIGYDSTMKRNEVSAHARTWVNFEKDYAKSKKPVTKGHISQDSIYMKFPEQANLQSWKVGPWGPTDGEPGRKCGVTGHGHSFLSGGMIMF